MEAFDQVFEVLVNWQTMLLCLGVYMITYFLRTLIQGFWKRALKNRLYKEIFLPLSPIVTGVTLAAFSDSYPWPMALAETNSGMLIYGGVCGLLSGWVYQRLRTTLKVSADKGSTRAAKVLRLSSPPPPPPDGAQPDESDESEE